MCVPERVVTNDDLATLMDTSDEWIRQRTGIGAQRIIWIGRKRARREHVEARDREPFRSAELLPGIVFRIAPALTRAGVEQDAGDRQIDTDTRQLLRFNGQLAAEIAPSIDAAGRKVSPAAVVGDVEIRIVFSYRFQHEVSRVVQPVEMQGKVLQFVSFSVREQLAAACANRIGGE